MKLLNRQSLLAIVMVVLSTLSYLVYYLIFHENQNMVQFLIESAVFLPIQVLFVTLIVEQALSEHERRSLLNKMNMVIGVFFSEVGTHLLRRFSNADSQAETLCTNLTFSCDFSNSGYSKITALAKQYPYQVEVTPDSLKSLQAFFGEKRDFLVGLLENPNLLEHDTFTDLLWAVFHLAEELACRTDVHTLPQTDYRHLAGDIKRAYSLLVLEWLAYMRHLKTSYPYLFSLAIRTNPFDPSASPEVRS